MLMASALNQDTGRVVVKTRTIYVNEETIRPELRALRPQIAQKRFATSSISRMPEHYSRYMTNLHHVKDTEH